MCSSRSFDCKHSTLRSVLSGPSFWVTWSGRRHWKTSKKILKTRKHNPIKSVQSISAHQAYDRVEQADVFTFRRSLKMTPPLHPSFTAVKPNQTQTSRHILPVGQEAQWKECVKALGWTIKLILSLFNNYKIYVGDIEIPLNIRKR